MQDVRNRRPFGLLVLLAFGAIVVGMGIFRGETSWAHYWELKNSEKILAKAVQNLETDNAQLSQEILKIKKSKSYARKVLRDKYHVTEDDEQLVFFPD